MSKPTKPKEWWISKIGNRTFPITWPAVVDKPIEFSEEWNHVVECSAVTSALTKLLGSLLPYDKDGKVNPQVTLVLEALREMGAELPGEENKGIAE